MGDTVTVTGLSLEQAAALMSDLKQRGYKAIRSEPAPAEPQGDTHDRASLYSKWKMLSGTDLTDASPADVWLVRQGNEIYNEGFEAAHELRPCGHSRGDYRDAGYIIGKPEETYTGSEECIGCAAEQRATKATLEVAASDCEKIADWLEKSRFEEQEAEKRYPRFALNARAHQLREEAKRIRALSVPALPHASGVMGACTACGGTGKAVPAETPSEPLLTPFGEQVVSAAHILTNCCQILDVVKPEWAESWSDWDQSVRDAASEWLKEFYVWHQPFRAVSPPHPENYPGETYFHRLNKNIKDADEATYAKQQPERLAAPPTLVDRSGLFTSPDFPCPYCGKSVYICRTGGGKGSASARSIHVFHSATNNNHCEVAND